MAVRWDIPGRDAAGGYGARYQYFDPVIWITLTPSWERHAERRHLADFSPDSVTAAQKSCKIPSQQTQNVNLLNE